ncbi:YlbL family protein [Cellulomonas sp. Leaf395]|uniref:YlbL family protein n=1 Tax=Cellulomonas sp. Leaf395 TaxID=1736362 RepID=UPI0006F37E43|nr:S16 family serine protease [Cellulomonas sp. Leaf395]KQS99930.1 signal protein PDZ [Cellulomonas sp. Leaf395]
MLDQPTSPSDVDDDQGEPDRISPRSLTLSVGMMVTALLLAVLVVMPVPYAISSPGPTRDVLGEHDGTPLIQISGAETFDSTGELRLTTVSGTGGPGYPSSVVGVLQGWLSQWSVVQPVELLYPPDRTQDEIDESNTAEMVSSQENATVAALTELGYDVPASLVVAGTVEGSDAEGKVEEGDVIVALDGTAVPDYQGLIGMLGEVEAGDTVTLTVRRHGEPVDIPIVTTAKDDGGAQIGVFIDPAFDMPVDVTVSIDDIGGPSAGTMFALGIVDKMTPEDEANGKDIAGTGTMDVTGEVGPIGGIRQKLAGATRDGATWFLAPAANCDEVVDHVPDGLRVVRIETLHEAREAITAIGAGTADDLPTCTS